MPRRIPHHLFRGHLLTPPSETVSSAEPFKSDDEALEGAYALFRTREEFADHEHVGATATKEWKDRKSEIARVERMWRQRLDAAPDSVCLARIRRQSHLNWVETEILAALLLDGLGLWNTHISDVSDMLGVLSRSPAQSLKALRALSETGALMKKGLVYCDDPDDDLRSRSMAINSELTESVLQGRPDGARGADIRNEKDLQRLLARLTRVMQKKSDALNDVLRGFSGRQTFQKWRSKQEGLLHTLDAALNAHPDWPLSRARKAMQPAPLDWCITLALMGKQLNHISAEDPLFTGGGLCRAVCSGPEHYHVHLSRLFSRAPLVRDGYIQPCDGGDGRFSESASSVPGIEYELTEKALELLGLDKLTLQKDAWDASLRTPRLRLRDLVLPGPTREAVMLALDHVRHGKTLMHTWGLGAVFNYGTGATMLFHGPPGTGKTATAEAVAHELGRPLLAVDYSRVQNCFVGQTEKNIVRIFKKARQQNAVLFWDEADAMFFDRERTQYTFEVRDVNVLLQEIERFEGVCILATNRKATLDKALERRISAKVEFPRPDRSLRESLWRKLIPGKLPLAGDVDLARLAGADLAGGEIKNIILNAARFACARDAAGRVTAEDFDRALAMETRERWSTRKNIGFQA